MTESLTFTRTTLLCDEVKGVTNFKPFVMFGGPNPSGTGGIQIFHAGAGETLLKGETFQQYMGPLWDVIKDHDELLRLQGSVMGPSQALSAPSTTPLNPSSTPQRSPIQTQVVTTLAPLPTATPATPALATTPTPVQNKGVATMTPGDRDILHPSHPTSPARLTPQVQTPWTPTHDPSWSLGPQHNSYVRVAAPYLISVPGGPGWENLLANYIIFESLSSSVPGLCKLPTTPRPEELAHWFKTGRRLSTPKNIPEIASVQVFEDKWVEWWTAIQPEWRDTQSWPFSREDATGRNWGSLHRGGKDGFHLIMVSLGWWIYARDPSKDSKVDDMVADVAWVIENLVSFLSAGDTTNSDSPPPTSPKKRPPMPIKIGPPTKRARLARSQK